MSKTTKRLALTTETLRPLSGAQLDAVLGGMAQPRGDKTAQGPGRLTDLSGDRTIAQPTTRQGGGGWGPGIGDPR